MQKCEVPTKRRGFKGVQKCGLENVSVWIGNIRIIYCPKHDYQRVNYWVGVIKK